MTVTSGNLLRLCLFLSTFGPAVLSSASALALGGSFVVDDFSIDDVGACNVESWASFARNGDLAYVTSPACVVHLGVPVEIGTEFQRTRQNNEWMNTGSIGGKFVLLPMTNGVGVSIENQFSWNMDTGAGTGFNFVLPVTFEVSKAFHIHLNGGYIRDQTERVDYGMWGLNLEYEINKQWEVIGEVFGQLTNNAPNSTVTRPRAQIGLRVTPLEWFDVDVIYGHNINGENSQWVTLGLNVRFDVIAPPSKLPARSGMPLR